MLIFAFGLALPCVAQVMTWGSLRLIGKASLGEIVRVNFLLRPHHLADDFKNLVQIVRQAFQSVVAKHECELFKRIPAVIVDGKWSVQMSLCNDRGSAHTWSDNLATGFLTGCTSRPLRGSAAAKSLSFQKVYMFLSFC